MPQVPHRWLAGRLKPQALSLLDFPPPELSFDEAAYSEQHRQLDGIPHSHMEVALRNACAVSEDIPA